jgi:tripartite ATP-independent transporter DctP family solute receptor
MSPATHAYGKGMQRYAEVVEKATQGKVKLELYPNCQLSGGSERTMAEQLMMGTQEMGLIPATLVSDAYMVFGLPFMFSNRQKAYAVCDGKVGQELLGMLEPRGLKGLALWENGYRQITNSKRPITKPEDMRGMKIRIPHVTNILETMKLLGVTPVPITFGELYMALQQGTADGQENPLSTIYTNKFYEVQKYITVINYIWSEMALVMNKSYYDKLPLDIQKVLYEKGREVAPYARGLLEEEDKSFAKKLEEAGMKVTVLTEAQIVPFREATKGVIDIMEPKIGKDIIEKVKAALR